MPFGQRSWVEHCWTVSFIGFIVLLLSSFRDCLLETREQMDYVIALGENYTYTNGRVKMHEHMAGLNCA